MKKVPTCSLPVLLTAALGACCLTVTLTTLYVLSLSHWHGPFRDMWEIYPFLEKIVHRSWLWSDLWESYGYAHRLFIPRLLFVADYVVSDANNHLLIAVSVLCQIAICVLFARVLFSVVSLSLWQRWCLFLLVVTFQFSGTLLFNFMHTFDVQWFLCCFFITAAFYLLTLKNRAQSVALLALSGVLIGLACLCNFSAMAAWPLWIFFGYIRLDSLTHRGIFFLTAIIFIAVYAIGIRSTGVDALGSVNILAAAAYFLFQFPLLYLGNPVSNPDYLPFGGWSVVFVIIPFLLLLRFGWKFSKESTSSLNQGALFLTSLMLFCYGVALMTGLGRGYDPGHVYASRYQNIVMLFWSAAIPFVLIETQNLMSTARAFFRTSGILFVAGLMACQWQSWNENLLLGRNVSRSHLALMMGYSDDVPMIFATVSRSMIYVPGYNLESERLLHEQSRKGIYNGSMANDWLQGVELREITAQCEGVEWKLTDRITPYTRFVDFTVRGEVESYDYALLSDDKGAVVALAIPEKEPELKKVMQRKWTLSPVVLRGFSRISGEEGLSLVMVSPRNRCINPVKL